MEFKYGNITSDILAASFAVHGKIGCGFMEIIYQRALAIELERRPLTFSRELDMPIYYDGMEIGKRRLDFIVENKICIELKAVSVLEPVHFAQLRNYLEVFNLEVGMLINFGSIQLEYRRLDNHKFNPSLLNNPATQKVNPKYL